MKNLLIRSYIKNYYKRKRKFISWNELQTIALLVDAHETFNKSSLDAFIKYSGKRVEVLYIDIKKKQSPIKDYEVFTSSDKNFMGLPNSKCIAKISRKRVNLLINCCSIFSDFSDCLAAHYEADFYCGFRNDFNNLDLIVDKKNSMSLKDYLEEVKRCVEMIKTR